MLQGGFLAAGIVFLTTPLLAVRAPDGEKRDNQAIVFGEAPGAQPASQGAPRAATVAPNAQSAAQWKQFAARYGGQWTARWDERTKAPSAILGSRIASGLPAKASDKDVEAFARTFVEANKALLGVGSADLSLLSQSHPGDGRRHVAFGQVHDGLPVYGATLKMDFDPQGNLVKISSSCWPQVVCKPEEKTSTEEAARMAAARIGRWDEKKAPGVFSLQSAQKVLYPAPGAGGVSFRLCHLLVIHLDDPLGDWVCVIDAGNGKEYVRYNNYRFGTVSGQSTAKILPMYMTDPPESRALENQSISLFNPTPAYFWNLSVEPAGWTKQGLWAFGVPNGTGGDVGDPAPTAGHTGSNVFGYNLTGGYQNSLSATQWLRSSAIDCSALTGTHVSFWRWLGVQYRDGGAADTALVEVSNNGTTWTRLWQNLTPVSVYCKQWQRVVYDISSVADGHSTVYVRWGMGPTNSSYNFCGWYLDDIEIYAGGGAATTSGTGNYSISYPGSGSMRVYANLRGPYADVYYDEGAYYDGLRVAYDSLVSAGTHNIAWDVPLTVAYTWDFTANPGWTMDSGWGFGQPTGQADDPISGHTGLNVYGYNLNGAYEANLASARYLTTAAIDCSALSHTRLRFWRWLGVESSTWDHASVEVSNDGSNWTTVWANSGGIWDSAWTQVTYDISSVADGQATVYIRWAMGPTDDIYQYCGWNIDDVEILHVSASGGPQFSLMDYDEPNVFYHLGAARKHIKGIEPAFTGMDYRVPALVRFADQFNNAFWDGEGINLGEGDGVVLRNLALYADVTYHEFNHGVTHQIYSSLPYTGESGALDEAFSDYFSCDLTNEPQIGEGRLPGVDDGVVVGEEWMRNLDNTLKVPDDWAGEVHDDGRIVGGAFWDLREALVPSIASGLIHFARYGLSQTFFDFYEDVLLQDDDNGNIADGTPNMNAIALAFGKHGIGGLQLSSPAFPPVVDENHNGKLDAGETCNWAPEATAWFLANNVHGALSSSSGHLTVSDPSSNIGSFLYGQTKSNPADPLSFSIAAGAADDEVMHATLDLTADGDYASSRTFSIINAPDQILYDDGASPGRYFGYGAPGGGFAVRFTPLVYPTRITAVRVFPSTSSAGAQITLGIWDDDGPSGAPGTPLTSWPVTVSGSAAWEEFPVKVAYVSAPFAQWNMDTQPTGWTTQGLWAWGQPVGTAGDPTSGHTGLNVFGYNLSGAYENNLPARYLRTGAINCSGRSGVTLRFWRWLGVESSTWDHASVEVSNNGSIWTTLWANGSSTINESVWTPVTYDISSVADGQAAVYVRWAMGPTDSSVTYCGWNIDDVQLLEVHQAFAPLVVLAGDVYLGWTENAQTFYNGFAARVSPPRTWVYDLSSGWLLMDDVGYPGHFLVRARVELPRSAANPKVWQRQE